MPTPAAHALGGLAAAFFVDSVRRRPVLSPALLAAAAAAAMAPDLDLLTGSHRTYTHSLGAIFIVGIVSWLITHRRVRSPLRAAVSVMAAYGSHLVLDWMGKDTSSPPGLTALWPFSSDFYVSGWNLFGEISRRYWLPREFILWNLQALAWELMVLLPVVMIAWTRWSSRTLETKTPTR
jgi:inner membrane protein